MAEDTTRLPSGTDAGSGIAGGDEAPSGASRAAPDENLEEVAVPRGARQTAAPGARGSARQAGAAAAVGRFLREVVIIVAIALVASALLRAFVVQAFFVPSGSMLPEIQLQDRILVSRIGEVDRGEVVVFEDPGGWIPRGERAAPPGKVRQGLEFVGVLPASGHEHLVKRAIGLPGDHVVCCDDDGRIVINGQAVDESKFLAQGDEPADNVSFDVTVPADHIFVLGDNRYVSGDSSRHLQGQDAFIPLDLVTGRAFAVIWPSAHAHILRVPSAYDDVPDGGAPPEKGIVRPVRQGPR